MITKTDAKRLDRQVRSLFDTMETISIELNEMLTEVRDSGAFAVLGFKSYEAYLDDVITGYMHVKRFRRQLVWTLSDEGYSQRDIAEKLSVDRQVVRNELGKREVGSKNPPVATKGRDGKSYPRSKPVDEATARPVSKLYCPSTKADSKFMLKRVRDVLAGATHNPTYAEIEQLESLLRRTLVKLDKLKQQIEQEVTA